MIHSDQAQGQLWQNALETQPLDVIWENIPFDLVEYLDKCDRQNLPDLLLMDMALKSPRSETLQSSSVCQWVSKQKASIKVVLFNPRQEKIKDVEHSWALRRGAADVLPRLCRENLMAEVARVTALIGCSLISQPLEKIAKGLAFSAASTQVRERELIVASAADSPKSSAKSEIKSDTGDVAMYRGVRIRR
jgi:CheY-like chemotaxis protein